MIRLIIVAIIIGLIFLYLWKKNNQNGNIRKSNIYKSLVIILIVLVLIFIIATSGKLIIPKLFNFIRFILPFLSKFLPLL